MGSWRILEGDCVAAMAAMPDASVDALVTDPPYDLTAGKRGGTGAASINLDSPYGRAWIGTGNGAGGFMGKAWDGTGVAFDPTTWREALRVLKPGGHLLAFGGTRTYHRLTCAIEDAGFEVRDEVLSAFEATEAGQQFLASLSPEQLKALDALGGGPLAWLYGSGFPKSLDVSKAIDKAAGAEREVVGKSARHVSGKPDQRTKGLNGSESVGMGAHVTAPATPDAERWQGWGTALKPAHEPIVLARKPPAGTVAQNVLTHGTGALNVDGCRIEGAVPSVPMGHWAKSNTTDGRNGEMSEPHTAGRWPANVVLDPEAAAMLDEQTGESASRIGQPRGAASGDGWGMTATGAEYDDSGGASRFFYVAKADTTERSTGLDGQRNPHPTVKPVALMRWLCRLVTPPGGTVLDPFCGSGTTGIAALREGFSFLGIEREAEYVAVARARIIGDAPLLNTAAEEAA